MKTTIKQEGEEQFVYQFSRRETMYGYLIYIIAGSGIIQLLKWIWAIIVYIVNLF